MTNGLQRQKGRKPKQKTGRRNVAPAASQTSSDQQQEADPLDQAIDEALIRQRKGDFEQAESIYRSILDTDPKHFHALHLLGLLQHQRGNSAEALNLIGQALELKPHAAVVHGNLGAIYHQSGRFEEAIASYDRAIELNPDYAQAHNSRGSALYRLKRYAEALASHERAFELKPDYAKALSSRGNALHQLQRFDEALASYDQAIDLKPDYAIAHINRGNLLNRLQRLDEALASYERAIELNPNYAPAHFSLGTTLLELERFDEAIASYERAIELEPDYAEAFNNLGNALHRLQRFDEAVASYERAIEIRPDYAEALNNRGNALHKLQRYDEALASYERVIELKPDYAEALNNRGHTLHRLRRFDEALASSERAIELKPDYVKALNSRGNALQSLGRFDEAVASYERAIELEPDYAEAFNNRGNALRELRRFEDALASYERAIDLKPDYATAHVNRGISWLLFGDFERGWREYEWRWRKDDFSSTPRKFSQPLWLGDAEARGKTILLHAEQGIGDTIQFCRYAPMVAATGARVVLEVQKPLKFLMEGLEGVDQLIAKGEALPHFDVQCPLMSLPLAFATRADTVPTATPYLAASSAKQSTWRDRLGLGRQPRIGLVWSGSPTHRNDHNRSIALKALAPILRPGLQFFSIQKEVRPDDQALLESLPEIRHFGEELRDFSDTAALVSLMDLVISVDTSVAHLAGAMGKRVWVLLPRVPDFRWLLDREDSPWYPSARLFRQQQNGNWIEVIKHVGEALEETFPQAETGQISRSDQQAVSNLSMQQAERQQSAASTVARMPSEKLQRSVPRGRALDEAIEYQRKGDFIQAEAIYNALLNANPKCFNTLHLYGLLQHQQGNSAKAVDLICQALELRPNAAVAHCNLGAVYHQIGQFDKALGAYERAIELKPDYPEAHSNRGKALVSLQRFDEALASYDRAIELQSDFAEAFNSRGNALHLLKRLDEALASYDRAIELQPDIAETHNCRGNALLALQRFDEALASYEAAIALNPDYAQAYNNCGNALLELERFDEALTSYDRSIELNPAYSEAFNNRGNALQRLQRYEEALSSYERALQFDPDYAQALNNRGLALQRLKRPDEALASYERAIRLRPEYVQTVNNRGNALRELGRLDEAIASYEQALELDPGYAPAHFNRSLYRLLLGDFARGWQEYEWRWQTDKFLAASREFEQPLWLGDAEIGDKTILLHAEQGIGDTIQFCRFAAMVAATGARVVLEVQKPLKPLMQKLDGVDRLIAKGEALPRFDLHCPLMSLPLAFATRLDSIPSATPYLTTPPEKLSVWGERLGPKTRPRIGLVWSGSPEHRNDHNRSIALAAFKPLLEPGLQFFSIQKEARADDQAVLDNLPEIWHFGDELQDFSDTAALVSLMDLVISVDTSVAHLAGALGKPVWVLLPHVPDFRWLLDREDSPWYPSARLFRQQHQCDWTTAFERVSKALEETFPRAG